MGRADEETHRLGRAEDFTRRGEFGLRSDFRPQLQGSAVFRGRNPRPAAAHRGGKRQEIRHLHRRVPKRGQLRRFAGVSTQVALPLAVAQFGVLLPIRKQAPYAARHFRQLRNALLQIRRPHVSRQNRRSGLDTLHNEAIQEDGKADFQGVGR